MAPGGVSVFLFSIFLLRIASAADVFAHFMVQNSYAYDVAQWKTDITAAQQIGIDGFALNWVPPDCTPGGGWQADRIADAFTAAQQMNFKLMHSFDMSYTECDIFWNQTYMASILSEHAGNSATYRWNSNILVSTFGGDLVSQYGNGFLQELKSLMKNNNAVSLAPALEKYVWEAQTNPTGAAHELLSDYTSIDGFLNWQAWPLNVQKNMSITPDKAFKSALKKGGRTGPYIMAVSPWQYKDLNDGNPMDAWVAYSDTLFQHRFDSIVGEDAFQPDIIELLTWNDFGESHYLRDLPSQEETATDYAEFGIMNNYIWGQEHGPWRIIAKYYISWWKTGKKPEITSDQVVYWYRIHPKAATCAGGSSTAIGNSLFPEDAVFAWALVKEPAEISLSLGSNQYWNFKASSSGPATGFVPFPSGVWQGGETPEVAIMRGGKMVEYSKGPQQISSDCSWQNFNPVVSLAGSGSDVSWSA